MMKKQLLLGILLSVLLFPDAFGQDRLLGILKQELTRQMAELEMKEMPPYYMNYRVIDKRETYISASFGALMGISRNHSRRLVPQIRIGSWGEDNFRQRDMGGVSQENGLSVAELPLEDEGCEDAVRQAIWNETNDRYRYAVDVFLMDKAKQNVNVGNEDQSPCFSKVPVEKYVEPPLPAGQWSVDTARWAERLKEISAVFLENSCMMAGDAVLSYAVERRYLVSSEGSEVVQNLRYARLMVNGETKADDGMELPLSLSYFAYDPADLPDNSRIMADVRQLLLRLSALREAPMVEPFTGPALLAGGAAGVFFHEIFGHRVEGQRMKSENDGQTFKKMLGQQVLPADMQVYDDPTIKQYAGSDLNGYYGYDDQGVKSQRVNVVVDGKLNDFLMTRTPIENRPYSNGHARGEAGFDPVSRQSNLIIETKAPKTDAELRQLLLAEAEKQGKEFGYYFVEVTSGFTYTAREATNAFNVTPLEVYKVYVDGRPDELVRGVDLIGTPLSMFSNIIYAGDRAQVFTGMCGAESGWVPVTAIAPTILVNKVEMQRKAKAQDLPPILPSPGKK